MAKKFLLHELELQEISLCADPANPEATVTLFKTNGDNPSGKPTQNKEDTMSKAEEDLAKKLGAVEAKLEEATKAIETLTATNKELAEKASELEKSNKGDKDNISDDDFLKSLSPDHRSRFEALMKSADVATATIAKMQEDQLEKAFTDKAAIYKNLPLEADKFGPVLQRLSLNKSTADDTKELDRILQAVDAMLGESELFKTAGMNTSLLNVGNASAKMDAAAAELMKSDAKLTKAAAISKVCTDQPELYGEYLAERKAAN